MKYNHKQIENKWQKHWSSNKAFKAFEDSKKPKHYILEMLPYPSAQDTHGAPQKLYDR